MCYNASMKKIVLFFCIVVLAFSVCACAQTDDGESENRTDLSGTEITFNAGDGFFASNGGTVVKKRTDGSGRLSVDKESIPRRDGYAFSGFYDGSTAFDSTASYTEPRTFTAKYIPCGDNILYEALFDENSTVAIDINMSASEWKKLDADYTRFSKRGGKSPIYRMSNYVTIDVKSVFGDYNCYFEEVGIRMKGNTSRHNFYNDTGFYSAIHMKLSFKETFDDTADGYASNELKNWSNSAARDFRKKRTLGGMEKIDIKYNSTVDESYVREQYAMKIFRENGIYAPNITLCKLDMVGESSANFGVYRIHEPIDEAFIKRRAIDGNSVGDLWKCTWGRSRTGADMTLDNMDNNVGVEDELNNEVYAYDKKTNKKKDKTTGLRDLSSMKNFLTAINGDNVDFDNYLDTDYFAKFEAINYILGNPDCIRNHANNYYVYFRKSDGKAIIIPYDYDRCLGSKQWDCFNGMSSADITPYTRRTTLDGGLRNPLYIHLIVKGAPTGEGSVLMRYRANLIAISKSELLKASSFDAYKNSYKNRYGKFVNNVVNGNNLAFDTNPVGNIPFADYISAKLSVMNSNIDNYYA